MSLFLGGTKIDAVYTGSQAASGFEPVTVFIDTVGAWTYPVPAGANRIDVVCFGAGGGGGQGGSTSNGKGGGAGGNAARTFTIGLDHPATNVEGTNGEAREGGNGTATTVTSGTVAVTGAAGTFANQSSFVGADAPDMLFNGNVYAGGKGAQILNGVGSQPGGGGGGGSKRGLASPAIAGGNSGGDGGTYLRFYNVGSSAPGLAQAVYLGNEKVWPIFVPQLSQWYSPGNATGTSSASVDVPWPVGAEFCDVITVGGGAGGTGTGVGGNPQKGGGDGQWAGATFTRMQNTKAITAIRIAVGAPAGQDGVGGGNFNTEAADGSRIIISCLDSALTLVASFQSNQGLDKTSNTNNRNGGNVAETFTFNGRTYTMASYGTNAGRGGATSNKNGGDGNRPGGGGQSADNGGLTGYNGGKGAHGAAQLYWY